MGQELGGRGQRVVKWWTSVIVSTIKKENKNNLIYIWSTFRLNFD